MSDLSPAFPSPSDGPGPTTPPPPGPSASTLRVQWPLKSFDSGVAGVPVLTLEPTEVAQSDLSAVLTAAREAGVTLIQE